MPTVTDIEGQTLFALSDLAGQGDAAGPLFALTSTPLAALIDHLYFTQAAFQGLEQGYRARLTIVVDGELVISPLGPVVGLVIGGIGGLSVFELEFRVQEQHDHVGMQVTLVDVPLLLRVSSDILCPLLQGTNEPDRSVSSLDIPLGTVTLSYDSGVGIDFSFAGNIAFPRCMIGSSGVIVSASAIRWLTPNSDNLPAGVPADFIGLYFDDAAIELDKLSLEAAPTFQFDYAFIGSGGFTGKLEVDNLNLRGSLMGFECELSQLNVTVVQGALVSSDIYAQLKLPFFDTPLGVEIGLSLDGDFTIALSATQPAGINYHNGLVTLDKADLFKFTVESLRFALDKGVFTIALSGEITPAVGGLEWPTFRIKELVIDSQGNILDGGWLNLPNQYSLEFYAFKFEITKLGFGKTEDGGKWIGFSGGLKLVEGMPAGASVEGLRITWYDGHPEATKITFNGIGVEFEVPGVLRFKGAVSYNTLTDAGKTIHRFDGEIKLELISLSMEIDAKLVVGSESDAQGSTYTFFAIYLGVELPAGIPLFSTGLALYGMAGLFALQMEPNKGAPPNVLHPASSVDEGWYENPDGSKGWYKREPVGVTDLKSKWDPRQGSLAFGVGVTIGTLSDNGTTFSGKFLLVIVFPGPIILLEGRGDLLRERTKGDTGKVTTREPLFRAISVLDNRAGSFTIGLDAWYKYDEGGGLIDIHGSSETFFDFHNAENWHIYLGRDIPREARISADIFKKLFQANAYFMLTGTNPFLRMGEWIGFAKEMSYGPCRIALDVFMQGDAVLSRKPGHLHGDLLIHGGVNVSIFGFGIELEADAFCHADIFTPFIVSVGVHVRVHLPWPFKDYEHEFSHQWGPDPVPPPLPLPLKEVAIEHRNVTTTWPLPRDGDTPLLVPNYDRGDGFILDAAPPAPTPPKALASIPVVPLDGLPHITFGRNVNDFAAIGVPVQPAYPGWERIGDTSQDQGPVKVRYSLKEVVLEKWMDPNWVPVARKAAVIDNPGPPPTWKVDSNPPGVKELFGSWAPVPTLSNSGDGVEQTKLWLWSTNPFDYSRFTGRAWDEWFTERYPAYPCVPPAPDREICCLLSGVDPDTISPPTWHCLDQPDLSVSWQAPNGDFHYNEATFAVPVGTKEVRITPSRWYGDGENTGISRCLDFEQYPLGLGANPRTERGVTCTVWIPAVVSVSLMRAAETRIVSINGNVGLYCGNRLVLILPRPAFQVDLTLTSGKPGISAVAFDEDGFAYSLPFIPKNPPDIPKDHFIGKGKAIRGILLQANGETVLHQICFEYLQTTATGIDSQGKSSSSSWTSDGTIVVKGKDIRSVQVRGEGTLRFDKVCAILDPDPDEVTRRGEMAKHFADELARWYQQGNILEPRTVYRLQVITTIEAQGEGELAGYQANRTQTEYAYFRTEGPPGLAHLSIPIGTPNEDEVMLRDATGQPITVESTGPGDQGRPVLKSDLNGLVRYVRQTVPATVPPAGQPPRLPRPVYRAYDVGVEFLRETPVDLLYRIDRHDLGLYLYSNNNQPVRDAEGRLIIISNRWGEAETLTMTESEERWIQVVNSSNCAKLDEQKIPRSKTLSDEGHVLDADTVYEARLIPLLLHEDFSSDGLHGWTALEQPVSSKWSVQRHDTLTGEKATVAGTVITLDKTPDLSKVTPLFDVILLEKDTVRSNGYYRIVAVDNGAKTVTVDGQPRLSESTTDWRIPQVGAVVQSAVVGGGTDDGRDPLKPGTILAGGEDTWSDYRVSAFLRSSSNAGAIGMVFRCKGAATFYRFSMDGSRAYRRLVRVVNNVHTILAEDDGIFLPDRDYLVSIEAIGSSLWVYLDGAPVFAVNDDAIKDGRIGLYCWNNAGIRVSDVRVDDFRPDAPVVYRFQFTTSQFTNFYHHLHSYQDETWVAHAETDVSALLASAVTPETPPTEAEQRAYQALAEQLLRTEANQIPAEVQVTRVEYNHQALGFLVRSPEPIDWEHTGVELSYAKHWAPLPQVPGAVKLTDVAFGQNKPNEEYVSLLLRERANLRGYHIEQRVLPGPLTERGNTAALLIDNFDEAESGVFFHEKFGPNALDHYTIVDEAPTIHQPHEWSVTEGDDGHIVQTGIFIGAGSAVDKPEKPGTIALTGSTTWDNVRISALLRSESFENIGVVFRYQDLQNFYRVSMDRSFDYRRLIKKVNGEVKVLWEDDLLYDMWHSNRLVIETCGNHLLGYLNDEPLFNVQDPDIPAGQVGFYCWRNPTADFEGLLVESMTEDTVLWQPSFDSMADLTIVDEAGALEGPSQWAVDAGTLTQSSSIYAKDGAWQQVTGSAHDIGIGAEGSVWIIGTDPAPGGYGIHRWKGDGWEHFGGALRIAVDNSGIPWAVNDAGNIFWWAASFWQKWDGTAHDIGISGDGDLWIVGTDPVPGGYGIYEEGIGVPWLPRAGCGGIRVAVAPDDRAWVVNDGGQIFHWDGNAWQQVPGEADDIGIGANGYTWLVRNNPAGGAPGIARWNGLAWEAIEGRGTAIAVDPDGIPWRVDDAQHIFRWSVNPTHLPGTYVLGGSSSWRDILFSARLRSDANGAIGVLFRYGDADNYYRFSMDREGNYRRLIKKSGGVVKVLWEDQVQYTSGHSYRVSIRTSGGWLYGSLDGVALFTVYDSDHPYGRVGLYCRANPGAHFERVLVKANTRQVGQWMVRDEAQEKGVSLWHMSKGELVQTSPLMAGETPACPGTAVVGGESSWTDYRLAVKMRSDTKQAIGVMFRYEDDDNYYRFSLDAEHGYRRLVKKVKGEVSTLWEDTGSFKVSQPFTLTIDAAGRKLTGYINDELVCEVLDDSHARGQVGLYCWGNTAASFERVEVRRLPLEASALLRDPGTLGPQSVVGDLNWTDIAASMRVISPSESVVGMLFRYQDEQHYYRFSMHSQQGYRRLEKNSNGTVSQLWEDTYAYQAGQPYEITMVAVGSMLRGYVNGVSMFVVEDSELARGCIGLYSGANTDAHFSQVRVYPADRTFAGWQFADSFSGLVPERWTFVDEGDQGGPSQWQVSGGELRQTSAISGGRGDPAELDKPGTCALAGDMAWTDYRLTVRLRSDDATGAIGVLFRYRDANNSYRFSMDQQGRRLTRKEKGNVSVLWEDASQYSVGREYVLTIDCLGAQLSGYLDGAPLFSVEDSTLSGGRIGLYCRANTGARFKEVLVGEPVWVAYYTFGREAPLSAGTRVRVYSGNSEDAPAVDSGMAQRFVASLGAQGYPHWSTDAVDLRLRSPIASEADHMRRFLPVSAYNKFAVQNVRVLRKADGTECFLGVMPTGAAGMSALTAGQYRLTLTFRRENSEAGTKTPEQVMIDIPWETPGE